MKRHACLSFVVGAAAAIAVAACSSQQYVFRPAEQVVARVEGQPAARYPVPSESPRGTVYVTSFGVRNAQDGAGTAALMHIRLVISNYNDDEPWRVDSRDQLLEIPGAGRSRPAYVNTDQQNVPAIAVAPGDRRVVDLYYALPRDMQSTDKLPPFEVLWNVRAGARVVTHRTPFDKVPLLPHQSMAQSQVALSYGWGPFWWHDPFYTSLTFRSPVYVSRPYPAFVDRPRYYARPGPLWRARPPGGPQR